MVIYGKIKLVIIMVKRNAEEVREYSELRSRISFNVKRIRKEQHMTQEELSERANISYDFMRRIESNEGKYGFSVYTLYKLAIALGVSMDELVSSNNENGVQNKKNIEKVFTK